jgi:NHL repeat-containing protein
MERAQAAVLGEPPPTGSGVFRFPQAIAYSPGASTIVVGDQYSAVVQRFDRSGPWLGELGSFADDRELGRVGVIGGVATDRAGDVFVLDSENDRIQVFDAASGGWLAAWGSTGQGPRQFRLGANTGAGGIAVDQPTAEAVPVVYIAPEPMSPRSTRRAGWMSPASCGPLAHRHWRALRVLDAWSACPAALSTDAQGETSSVRCLAYSAVFVSASDCPGRLCADDKRRQPSSGSRPNGSPPVRRHACAP